MNQKNLNIKSVLSKLRRDIPYSFEDADAIEWIGEALDAFRTAKDDNLEERVAFVEVKNHECLIPNGTIYLVQIARNNVYESNPETACCAAVAEVEQEESEEVYDFVPIDCNGTPVADYELAYYRPFWDLQRDYGVLVGTTWYRRWYTPVRLANSSFFNSLVCSIPDSDQLYENCQDEYTVNDPYLRFSFKEGFVAISYITRKLDAEGYPMIPNTTSHMEAVTRYVTYRLLYKMWLNGDEGAERRMLKAEQDWHWYCKQAGNLSMMPKGIDEHQDHLDMRNYLLPRLYRYYGYFGRLAAPENRYWNNTMTRYAI